VEGTGTNLEFRPTAQSAGQQLELHRAGASQQNADGEANRGLSLQWRGAQVYFPGGYAGGGPSVFDCLCGIQNHTSDASVPVAGARQVCIRMCANLDRFRW
jgi:hypothetical protein